MTGVSRPPVLDFGTTFHPGFDGLKFPSILLDDLWKHIFFGNWSAWWLFRLIARYTNNDFVYLSIYLYWCIGVVFRYAPVCLLDTVKYHCGGYHEERICGQRTIYEYDRWSVAELSPSPVQKLSWNQLLASLRHSGCVATFKRHLKIKLNFVLHFKSFIIIQCDCAVHFHG